METILLVLERYGLATAFLGLVCFGGWKLLAQHRQKNAELFNEMQRVREEKDAEIKRINEARLEDQKHSNEVMLGVVQEFTGLVGETNKTLVLFKEELTRQREDRTNAK